MTLFQHSNTNLQELFCRGFPLKDKSSGVYQAVHIPELSGWNDFQACSLYVPRSYRGNNGIKKSANQKISLLDHYYERRVFAK